MNKSRILIVEDEAIVARDLSGQLTELGYEPAGHSTSGEEALALAEQLRPDLVLMDIHLKGAIDGIAAAQAIRERFAIAVVFISAYVEESVLDRANAALPHGYVTKPFQSNELRRVIDLALTKHQAETQMRQVYEEKAAILQSAMDGFWLVDPQGRILEVNEAYCRMSGYSAPELLAMRIPELEASEKADDTAAQSLKFMTQGKNRFETRHRRKDGSIFRVEVSVQYRSTEGGRLVAFLRDITDRKQAEEALKKSETWFRSLFENASDGILYLSTTGEIVEVNHAFARMHGYSVEEMQRMNLKELDAPETARQFTERIRRIMAGQVLTFEVEHYHKEGYTFPLEVTASVITVGHEKYILAFLRDITDRKRAEEQLGAITERLRHATAAAKAGVWDWNLQTNEMIWDDRMRELYGLTLENFPGGIEAWKQGLHPDDSSRAIKECEAALRGERDFDTEFRVLRPDGTVVHLKANGLVLRDEKGKLLRMIGLNIDITERKRAEEQLIAITKAVESASDAIGISDVQWRHFYQNRALSDLFEYATAEELQAAGGPSVVFKDPRVAKELFENIRSGKSWAGELELVTKTGRVFPAHTRADAIIDGEGKIIGLIAVIVDISERKRAEEAVQSSLHEKESLLKEIHHRVKNNLQVISSLLRLQAGQIDNPIAKAALRDMQSRVRSMALIHEYLYRSENLAQVDMAGYLKQLCTQLCRALVAQPNTVRLHLDLAPVRLEIDQAVPCGLLVNELFGNALKHGFPEGRTGEVRVDFQPVADGPGLRLRVADTGVGLPADFDLNTMTSLGLKLVRELTSQLGGQLEIKGGAGTVFEVFFTPPCRNDPPAGGKGSRS
jgi:PAS domain S-box-containing protein